MKFRVTDSKLQDYLKQILTVRPDLRDSDSSLIAHIWYFELKEKGHDPDKMTATELLKLFKGDHLTSTESIRRCRQKVQELYSDTRGNKYRERHVKSKEVRDHYANR